MVYIPRRKQRKRFDGRSSQVVPSTPVANRASYENSAIAKVLDNMANKMAPAILAFYQQKDYEDAKSERNKHINDFREDLKNKPLGADKAWMDGIAEKHMQKAKQSESFEQWGESFRNVVISNEIEFDKNYVNTELPKLAKQMEDNNNMDFTSDMQSVGVNRPEKITAIASKYLDSSLEDLIKVREMKLGRPLSVDEISEYSRSEEATLYLKQKEEYVKKEFQKKALKEIRSMSAKNGVALDESLETLNAWIGKNKSRRDYDLFEQNLKNNPTFSFLNTVSDLEIDEESFFTLAKKELSLGEGLSLKNIKLDREKNYLEATTGMKQVYPLISDAIIKGKKDDFNKHIEEYRELIDKAGLRSKYEDVFRNNAYDILRKKHNDGDNTRHFMNKFSELVKKEDWVKTDWGDPKSVLDFMAKNNVKVEHQDSLGRVFLRFHKSNISKHKSKLLSISRAFGSVLDQLDALDNPKGMAGSVPSHDRRSNYVSLTGMDGKSQVTHGRLFSKYMRLKKEVQDRYYSVIQDLSSGKLNFDPSSDRYIGTEVKIATREVVHGNLIEILNDAYKTDTAFERASAYSAYGSKGMMGKTKFPTALAFSQKWNELKDAIQRGHRTGFDTKEDPEKSGERMNSLIQGTYRSLQAYRKMLGNSVSDEDRKSLQEFAIGILLLKDFQPLEKDASSEIYGTVKGSRETLTKVGYKK